MFDTENLKQLEDTTNYTSWALPNGCALFTVKTTEYPTYPANLGEATVAAFNLGKRKLADGECAVFTVNTIDCVADEPDTGMVILLVQRVQQ